MSELEEARTAADELAVVAGRRPEAAALGVLPPAGTAAADGAGSST
jgi:hypothetical protein